MSPTHRTPPGVRLGGDRNCCPGCGLLFNSTAAFDKHRTGPHSDRRCRTVDEMRERGMDQNAAGFWVTELREMGQ